MKRKPIPKKTRQLVYAKYQGNCAYCGKEIDFKDMQVDHATPFADEWYGKDKEKVRQMIEDGSIDGLSNLMPACRACNFYKGGGDIESFRYKVFYQLSVSCRSTFQTRLAMQFGMIEYRHWDGKFYFEKCNEKKDNENQI